MRWLDNPVRLRYNVRRNLLPDTCRTFALNKRTFLIRGETDRCSNVWERAWA